MLRDPSWEPAALVAPQEANQVRGKETEVLEQSEPVAAVEVPDPRAEEAVEVPAEPALVCLSLKSLGMSLSQQGHVSRRTEVLVVRVPRAALLSEA